MADNKKKPERRGLVGSLVGRKPADKPADKKTVEAKAEKPRETVKAEDKKKVEKARQQSAERRKRAAAERKRREAKAEKERIAAEKAKKAEEKKREDQKEKLRQEENKNLKFHVLHTESGDFETTFNKMYESRKPWIPEDPKQILSFMPGTVEEIPVGKGDEVKEGDVLMIFRAMKMNNKMLSPVGGKVKTINVKPGENVPKNTVMIELE